MNCYKRLTSILLAALLIFCALTVQGCKKKPGGETTPEPTVTEAPTPAATEVPGTNEKSADDEAFEAILDDVLVSSLVSDGLSYHMFVADPAYFGIDEHDVNRGWGEYSYEAELKGYDENDELLEELAALSPDKMCETNRLAYKSLVETLNLSNELRDFYYYNEPLTPLNGEHTMTPLLMTMYEINTKEDVENYLLLLEDTPRYLGDLLAFEREKAARGLFMTTSALDQVIESCDKYAADGEDFFLIEYLQDVLDEKELGLTAEEKAAYLERNHDCIINGILPAYSEMAETLNSLRFSCRKLEGAAARSEEELQYYKAKIKTESALNETPEKMASMLDRMASKLLQRMMRIISSDWEALNQFGSNITSLDPAKDIEYLKTLIADMYPEIPEQEITYINVPDALADDFSPAAYLLSAFDDPSRNVVMLNPSADKHTLLLTMAHECFPGHLYQSQYFRHDPDIHFCMQALAPAGYSEGWAVFSEQMIAENCDKYGTGVAQLEHYNSSIANIIIPAYISIRVNCDGWSKADIEDYLTEFGLNDDDYINIIYEYSINMPHYFFNYAMGYTSVLRIYETVSPSTNAEKLAFFKEYLDCGPLMFDVLNEKFGVK